MTLGSISRRAPLLALVALLPAGLAAHETNQPLAMQKEGIELIGLLEEVARDVRYNAERLNSFSRNMQISRWTHFHHLQQIKDLVNDGLQPALDRLTEIQPYLPEWKQQSIDKMFDSARALAADTNSAILEKNEAGALPVALHPDYQELITRISAHAEQLVKTSDAAGSYASASLKALEAGLHQPPQ